MWLDSLWDNLDSLDSWSEKTREDSEKTQERKDRYSKWLAWIKRIQKDEKKAKKDNDFLFDILVEILKNNKYDILIPFIVDLMEKWVGSNFIIWAISLVNDEAVKIIKSNYSSNKNKLINEKKVEYLVKYKKTEELIKFNEDSLDPAIKKRINEWVDDIFSIISFDPSVIVTQKFLSFYNANKDTMTNLLVSIITFFLYELNIIIDKNKAFLYCSFILWEVKRKVSEVKLEEI